MTIVRSGLLAVMMSSVPVLAAEPLHVIIFSGGVTEADGNAALSSFKKLEPLLPRAVTLPKGEPKVLDSSTLPGLKPGFRVVTLGVCRTPGPVLATLKALYPGTYSKPLTGDVGPERCPVVTGVKAEAIEPAIKVGTSVINAFTLSEQGQDERGRDTPGSSVGFALVEKSSGLVRSVLSVEGAGVGRSGDGPAGWEYLTCNVVVEAEKAGFVVTRSCDDERTGCELKERAIPKKWTERERVTVKGEALTSSGSKKSVSEKSACVAGADEGD